MTHQLTLRIFRGSSLLYVAQRHTFNRLFFMMNLYATMSGLGRRTKAFAALFSLVIMLGFSQQVFAEANYVYHEQTTNNPGCGPNYMSTTSPTNAAGVQLAWKIEYQFYTTNTVVYYTTDGSTPSGAFGVGTGTTQVLTGSYNCTFPFVTNVDVATATIPAQAAGKTVKYIISSWHSGGGDEIFANGPGAPCGCGTPTNSAGLATVFTYTVAASNNVEVTSTGGTALASYATLKGAFDAVNAGTHTGSITVKIYGNTTETATAALNASGTGSASYTSMSIQPAGGAARSVSGAITAGSPMIDFNGADNVTVDGLNSGGNSLTFSNTTVSATSGTATIRFQADATNNTITKCSVLGSATMAVGTNGGNISFQSAAISTGNDNNTISFCDLGPAGANLPSKCIHFSGTSNTDPGTANSGIIITGNNIFDYFSATVASAGIDLNSGTVGTTISNNKFYQTATRTQTTGSQHNAIRISNTSGNAYQITGNTIGFASSTGTGAYTLVGVSSSSVFIPIFLSVGTTTASSVQGNTIAGINFSGAISGTSSSASFRGIYVSSGLTTIGDVTGNTIGSMSSTGSIVVSSSSTSTMDVIGIHNFGTSNWTTNNNNVGGITVSNSSTGAACIYGIRCFTGSGVTWTCNNNTIGGTVANSINSTSTAAGTIVNGILNSAPAATMTGNTVRNMTVAGGTGTTSTASMIGICITASSANHTVGQNTIFNLSNSNATAATVVTGIQYTATTGTNIVERNNIYALTSATNSTSAEINGIRIAGGTTTYRNNMIALGAGVSNAIGSAASNSGTTGIVGINEALGTNNIWHNNIYIGGTATAGTGASYAFNGVQTTNTRSFRDNIFVNARTNSGATGKHYAVKINGTTVNPTGLTINNNIYYASGSGAAFGYFNSADVANLAAWKVAVGQDVASFESDPQYNAPTASTPDLHIHATNPTQAEGNGVDLGVTNDYDNQTRSGLTPVDIGADAGNFVSAGDISAPAITYTALTFTCSTSDRTLSGVTITDASGVPTTGVLVPRIYYRKGAGSWFSQPGTLTAGTGTSGTWSFTIVSADMGGLAATDVVSYYVIAQDVAGTPNIGSNPFGVVATSVNAVTTPPSTPNSYTISSTLAGTYNVGVSQTYTTLTAAINAYNTSCLSGAVTFQLMDATYPSETYPITINANPDASATNTLTIKPATGVTATISGTLASNALIRLNGADYITIDGSNNGSTSRDLTINNTSTTAPSGIALVSAGTGVGATNNTIKNVNITTGTSTSIGYGIAAGGTTIGTAGDDNDNNIIQNNAITSPGVGIYAGASASGLNNNLDINNNTITYSGSLSSVIGIQVLQATGASISQNTINITTSSTTAPVGISLETGVVSSTVSRNTLGTIISTNTGGYGGRGITVGTGNASSNITISNNMIYGVNGTNWSSFSNSSAMGIAIGVIGGSSTLTTTAGGINLFYNSISMSGSMGTASSSAITTALYVGSGASAMDIRNNIFASTQVATSTTQKNYAIYSAATSAAFTNINYNDYYVTNTFNAGSAILGNIGATDRTTLAAVQTGFGGNTNSIITNPNFVNVASNLHINTATLSPVDNTGTPVAVTTDFDGDSRSATTPDMGLDEMTSCLNITVYADADGDTYGDPSVTAIDCDGGAPPAGYVLNNSDCDDTNAAINPTTIWYLDADGDLYYTGTGVTSCTSPGVGYAYTGLTAGGDCNDANSAVNPGATEICNGIDDDCDGSTDEGVLLTFYADADSDTYGDAATSTTACSAPVGYVSDNTDCNDANAAINPAAIEICNLVDDDCDGLTDEGVTTVFYADADSDGFGDAASTTNACSAPTGYVADNTDCNDALITYADLDGDTYGAGAMVACGVANNTDCDDSDAAVNPGATEICNGIDDDCDGNIDEAGAVGESTWYADVDGDTYGDPASSITACTAPVGYVGANDDCDDTNAAINPGATEVCNGVDDDCDGLTDEGVTLTFYADADADTYGDAGSTTTGCTPPVGYVTDNTDCNDANAAVNPGATEVCNGIDDDCDGSTDEGLTFTTYYADADGDSYGDATSTTTTCDGAPVGYVADNTDCNDANNTIYPTAPELCDGLDNDCDLSIDEGLTFYTYYADAEGDGFGDPSSTTSSCSVTPPSGYVADNSDCQPLFITYTDADGDGFGFGAPVPCGPVINNVDCDDTQWLYQDSDGDGYGAGAAVECGVPTNTDCAPFNAAINPGATEVCNAIDDDCDGFVDDGILITYYADTDGDTYGDPFSSITTCSGAPVGYVLDNTDCEDIDANIHPGATEVCNGLDDDCNGLADDGLVFITYYSDSDSDGYGDPLSSSTGCSAPVGFVTDNTDCNDANAAINPGATEICNAIDDDCDGTVDDGLTFTTYYVDVDGDGYGNPAVSVSTCDGAPFGYVTDNTDCEDNIFEVNPATVWYLDNDADLYYTGTGVTSCTSPGPGYVYAGLIGGGDCNDGDTFINPGATEICNGIDDDCDGSIDEGLTFITYYADADGDTYGDAGTSTSSCSGAPFGYVLDNTDCNDSNAAINPAATEICDGIDNDCDGLTDEGVLLTFYADADGDTYGDPAVSTTACSAPVGYVANNTDCDDTNPTVPVGALAGTFSIPSACFPTIASAVTALNTSGVGGAVVFNVSAGHTETAPSGGIGLTATGTVTNTITFQKSGAGANPLITAYTGGTGTPGSASQDGIFRLVGSDYVTIDGIDLTENAANTANPATMEYGYGLFKASATNGAQNNTIKNSTITLNRINNASGSGPSVDGSRGINMTNATAAAQTTTLTVTAASGANSNNKFYSNTIQNCNIGIAAIGYADVSPYTNADQNNDIGGASASTGNTIKNYGGATGATNPAAGVRTLAQYGLNVSYNTINSNDGAGVNHPSTLRGIYTNTAVNASQTISNNSVTIKGGGTTSQLSAIENVAGGTGAGNTVTISNNTINVAYPTVTSGTVYGIYNNGATASNLNIEGNNIASITLNATAGSGGVSIIYNSSAIGTNLSISNNVFTNLSLNTTGTVYMIYSSNATNTYTINNNSISGTFAKTGAGGTVYGFYDFGSPTGGTATVTNNNYSNVTVTGATTFYGIYQATSTSQIEKVNNNTVSNVTGGSSSVFGIHHNYGAVGSELMNNTVFNLTGTSTVIGLQIGNATASLGNTVAGNTVYGINTTGTTATGILHTSGNNTSLYKNKVYDITSNNTAGLAIGLSINGGLSVTAYNNLIGDIKAPATNLGDAVRGISVTSTTASSSVNVYNNTVYLNASSTGATFGTSGVYHTTSATATTAALSLRNNIIVNNSTPNGTGVTSAYRRSSSTLTNYASASNNNLFYAGTPSATRVIYYDGTTVAQTLANYQAVSGLAPRDNVSVTENPTFASLVGANANYLHFNAATSTFAESGGVNIAGITTDYDNDIRSGNPGYTGAGVYPDLGADEFEGVNPALFAIDAGATVLVNPLSTATCFSGTETVTVTIRNYGYTTLDFTTTPATVTTNVTGAATATLSATVSTGTLAPGATLDVIMTGTLDMTTPGTYTFDAFTTVAGDGNAANDAMIAATRTSLNPTVSLTALSPVCEGSTITLTATSAGGTLTGSYVGSNLTPVVIPDNVLTGATSTITLAGPVANIGASTQLQVGINVATTFSGDVDAYLIGPAGCGTIELTTDNGSSGDGFNITLYNTGAYPSVTTLPTTGTPTGNYMMEGTVLTSPTTLSGTGSLNYPSVVYAPLNGCPINGTWTMFVGDDASGDVPTLNSWSLTIVQPGVGNYTDAFSGPGTFGTTTYSGANNSIGETTVTGLTPGTYTFSVTTTDAAGCSSAAATTSVTVLANATYYADADGDSYGDAAVSVESCTGAPVGYVSDNTDCNDANAAVNPGATEICNGIDDDCDGLIDEGLTFTTYYADADGDGYGDATISTTTCDGAPVGYVADNTDCDDANAAINPGATEICNGIDDDCDGLTDEGLTFADYYVDADGDGYGDASATPVNSCSPIAGSVTNNLDCNDSNNMINPAGTEICNGVDDDCDGIVDDGILYTIYYADADGDTYGDATDAISTCDGAPVGYVADNTDCNDANAAVNPGATEVCNGIDDDCDGSIDEGLTFTTYYADADGDGYGDAFSTVTTCDGMPVGYVTDNTDCDDTQSTVYPGATEICDGLDNDCDGDFDEGTVTATITPAGPITICKGVPTPLFANTGVGYTYQWFKNGNVILGATSDSYAVTKPGNYQVQVNTPEGCFALSSATLVQVNPQPNANISAPNGTSLCVTVKLKASYDATYTWQWYKDGSPIGGATSYLYIATTPGSYECEITNGFGCTRTTAALTVTACREGETVESVAVETFELYPNPTESIFTLDMELNTIEQEASVYILNLVGEQVYEGTVGVDNGTVNTTITLDDDVAAGMYVVKVIVAEKEYTKQLIIQK